MEATPFTIAMVNRKGGCAKTGTTHQLSGAFAKMGLRVLLVDMDPQASLTQGFFGPAATEAIPREKSIVALFDDACDPDPEKMLLPTPCEGITLLPGANSLDDFNIPKPTEAGPLQTALRSFLKEVAGQIRRDPHRLPAEPPPVQLERPVGCRLRHGARSGRGLRGPGHHAHPAGHRPRPGEVQPELADARLPRDAPATSRHSRRLRDAAPKSLRSRTSSRRAFL